MEPVELVDQIKRAANAVLARTPLRPVLGLVLGSGLGDLSRLVSDAVVIPYSQIPHFPVSSAPGHRGELHLGRMAGLPVVLMKGRVHLYEGYTAQEASFPIRVMRLLGVERLLITNSAGGLNANYRVGDIMLIRDHLSIPNLASGDPTRGPNLDHFGARFTSLNGAYSRELQSIFIEVARDLGVELKRGVYAHVAGPCFETPSEVRFLSAMGGDAVGMSTVPEVCVARHCGMQVLAASAITNLAIREDDSDSVTCEQDVWEAIVRIVPRLERLIEATVTRLAHLHPES